MRGSDTGRRVEAMSWFMSLSLRGADASQHLHDFDQMTFMVAGEGNPDAMFGHVARRLHDAAAGPVHLCRQCGEVRHDEESDCFRQSRLLSAWVGQQNEGRPAWRGGMKHDLAD